MWFILAILSSLSFGWAGFMMKISSFHRGSVQHLLWGLYFTGAIGFLVWMMFTESAAFSYEVLLAGIIIGFGSAVGNILFMKALEVGPASLTTPLININIVLTIAMSLIIYGERITLFEAIGVVLLVLAVSLLPIDPNESLRIRNPRWYALIFLATLLFFLRNGGLKITEELDLSNSAILFVSYVFGLIWFTVEGMMKPIPLSERTAKIGLGWGLATGIFSFAGLQIYAVALQQGPASIVAPIFAANSLVVAILSIWWYKERLSLIQTLSLILLFVGLIFIRMN